MKKLAVELTVKLTEVPSEGIVRIMRTPKTYWRVTPEGHTEIKTTIPKTLALLIEQWSQRAGCDPIKGFDLLLMGLADRIDSGDYNFLGASYQKDIQALAHADKIRPGGIPAIDENLIGKFHRSTKFKSGFFGVYANGRGFRAVGRVLNEFNTDAKLIGSFPTSELAAQARYHYYRENKLVYGIAEEEILRQRSLLPDSTEYEILEFVNELRESGLLEPYRLEDDYKVQLEKRVEPTKAVGLDVPVPGRQSRKFGITEGLRLGERIPDPFGLEVKANADKEDKPK